MMKYIGILVLALVIQVLPLHACDLCSVYNFVEASSGSKGNLNTGVSYRVTHYASNVRPDGFEKFPGQHLDSNIWQLYGNYSLSEQLSAQVNLPLIYKDYRRLRDGRVENGSESGIGDASFLLRYAPFQRFEDDSASRLEFFTGVKLPTGDSDPLKVERDQYVTALMRHSSIDGSLVGGDDLALGSGSYDFLFGTNGFHQMGRMYFQGSLQYSLRQEGDYDYEYGDDFQWEIGPGYYLILEDEQTLSARIRFSGEYKKEDSIVGIELAGSDEYTNYLGFELNYSHGSNWFANLGIDLPVVTESAEEQVVPRYRMLASVVRKIRF
ncbi:MAG: hypothetical protein KDD62_14740 [Bdellovibrionales bacterium]|nr:hypothetical protein [Bdellovibrionales bacterium]